MDTFNIAENSEKLAIWYRDISITVDELNRLEDEITKECRRYLIGKICEREKNSIAPEEMMMDVCARLGQIFGYNGRSINFLIAYANAIEYFQRVMPDIASDILRGQFRLSFRDTIKLAKMNLPDMRRITKRLSSEKTSAKIIFREQMETPAAKRQGRPKQNYPELPQVSVKDTPPYDPDAQIAALSLTVPSWVNTIEKTFMNADFQNISQSARNKLADELTALKDTATAMIATLAYEN